MQTTRNASTSEVQRIPGTSVSHTNYEVRRTGAPHVREFELRDTPKVLTKWSAKFNLLAIRALTLLRLLFEMRLQSVNEANELLQPWLHPSIEVVQSVHRAFLSFLHSVGMRRLWSRGNRSQSAAAWRVRLPLPTLAACLSLTMSFAVAEQGFGSDKGAPNVFAAALIHGRAAAPIPLRPGQFTKIVQNLQAHSGSMEPVSILAARVLSFKQQPRCGRVQFALGQPASKIVFAAFGGQMNVCEDGQPPLRTCEDRPNVLVPATGVCPNGKSPVDTEEVAAAIRAAGGQTHEEMLRSWLHDVDARAHASAKLGSGAASTSAPTAASAAGSGPSTRRK